MTVADRRSQFIFDVAGPGDDAELRSLFRNIPMDGAIRVAFEREPNFFAAAAIRGDFHQVGIVREAATQKIVGTGTRTVGRAFLNGKPCPLGYLCDLRLSPKYRGGTLVARGYRFLREFHQDGRTQLYYTVIFADNERALQTIATGRSGLPSYHDCGLIRCPGINLLRRKPPIAGHCHIARGSLELLPEIVECLNRNNRRRQFAPVQQVSRSIFFPMRAAGGVFK